MKPMGHIQAVRDGPPAERRSCAQRGSEFAAAAANLEPCVPATAELLRHLYMTRTELAYATNVVGTYFRERSQPSAAVSPIGLVSVAVFGDDDTVRSSKQLLVGPRC